MDEIILILVGLLATVWVNWVADVAPGNRSLRESWRWPLLQVRSLIERSRGAAQLPPAPVGDMPPLTRRHALVAIPTVALTWFAFNHAASNAEGWLLAFYSWLFLAIAIIDLEHRRVPNRLLLAAFPVALLVRLPMGFAGLLSGVLGAAVGFGLFLALALAWPGAMGMGDVKLAGFVGLVTGIPGVLVALVICIFAGGLGGLFVLLRTRFRRGQHIAYAPYLVCGAWFALFYGSQLWQMYLERI